MNKKGVPCTIWHQLQVARKDQLKQGCTNAPTAPISCTNKKAKLHQQHQHPRRVVRGAKPEQLVQVDMATCKKQRVGRSTPPQPIYRGEKGRLAGMSHPNARLTDTDIELMRSMHELQDARGRTLYGYRKLGRIFECSRFYARRIVKGSAR